MFKTKPLLELLMWRKGAAVLFLVMLAPAVAALSGTGAFTTSGPLQFDNSASATIRPLAILVPSTTELRSLDLSANQASVCWFENRLLSLPDFSTPEPNGKTTGCYEAIHPHVTLIDGDQAGFLGFYPASDSSAMIEAPSFDARSTAELKALGGNGGFSPNQGTADTPEHPYYDQVVAQPNLLVAGRGALAFFGSGSLKLNGPDIRIDAQENQTTFTTGDHPGSNGAERILRWVVISFKDANVSLTSPSGFQAIARDATDLHFETLTFTPDAGSFETTEMRYNANRESTRLTGHFIGSANPTQDGSEATLQLQGEITTTTFTAIPIPSTHRDTPASFSWTALLVSAAVLATGVGAVIHRRQKPGPTTVYFTHYAYLAEEQAKPAVALEWLQAARNEAPDDAELATWEAALHNILGQTTEALAAYEEASLLDPTDSEPAYWSAVILVQRGEGHDNDRALEHLERAIARTPELAGCVENDPLFRVLHGPDFEAMLDDACDRLERDHA